MIQFKQAPGIAAISRSFLALEQGEVGRGIQIVEEALQGNKQAIVSTVLAICYFSLAAP